jgi:hypothetical protein
VMIFTIFLESYFYDGCCRRNGGRIFILHLFVMDEQFRDLLMFGAPVDSFCLALSIPAIQLGFPGIQEWRCPDLEKF